LHYFSATSTQARRRLLDTSRSAAVSSLQTYDEVDVCGKKSRHFGRTMKFNCAKVRNIFQIVQLFSHQNAPHFSPIEKRSD